MSIEAQSDTRLPNLDASRFLAFIPVFLTHVFFTSNPEIQSSNWFGFLKSALNKGPLGLDYFFVLSAFIITWLALKEKKKFGDFFSLAFFLRRILRTWPLYFLIVLTGFLMKMYFGAMIHSLPDWQWWATFSINYFIADHGYDFLFFMVVLWSVSIEEQFYFLWGFILEAPSVFLPLSCFLLILLSLIFRCDAISNENMLYFHSLSVAGNFGVGALLAWWTITFNKTTLPSFIVKFAYVAFFISLLAYTFLFSNPLAIVLERFWFSILFAVIIFDWAFNQKPLTNPGKYPVLNFLGQISLGLYVFHALVISVFSYFNYRFDWSDSAWQVTLINPLLIFLVTLILAMLSYKYFEKPFLKFRTWGQELSRK